LYLKSKSDLKLGEKQIQLLIGFSQINEGKHNSDFKITKHRDVYQNHIQNSSLTLLIPNMQYGVKKESNQFLFLKEGTVQ